MLALGLNKFYLGAAKSYLANKAAEIRNRVMELFHGIHELAVVQAKTGEVLNDLICIGNF